MRITCICARDLYMLQISFLILHHIISIMLMLTFGIFITQVNTAVPPTHAVVLAG